MVPIPVDQEVVLSVKYLKTALQAQTPDGAHLTEKVVVRKSPDSIVQVAYSHVSDAARRTGTAGDYT